jgi:hypothetical protein
MTELKYDRIASSSAVSPDFVSLSVRIVDPEPDRAEYLTNDGISFAGSKNLHRRQAFTVWLTSIWINAGVNL